MASIANIYPPERVVSQLSPSIGTQGVRQAFQPVSNQNYNPVTAADFNIRQALSPHDLQILKQYSGYYLTHPELQHLASANANKGKKLDSTYYPSHKEVAKVIEDKKKAHAYKNIASQMVNPDNYPGGWLTMLPALPIMGPLSAGFSVAGNAGHAHKKIQTRNYPEALKQELRNYPANFQSEAASATTPQ